MDVLVLVILIALALGLVGVFCWLVDKYLKKL